MILDIKISDAGVIQEEGGRKITGVSKKKVKKNTGVSKKKVKNYRCFYKEGKK
jgi:hypothetical protein